MLAHRPLALAVTILGLTSVGLVACPKPGGPRGAALFRGSAPLLKSERTAVIYPLAYRTGGGGAVGRARIRVGPNEDRVPEVGVLEGMSGGIGKSQRTALWVAAFMASTLLGRELIDYRFSVSRSGFADGPSSSALFTAAIMALILNQTINPKATMTGTVNPDGTVGPVGGIPDKFEAALQKGFKVLGYPIGQKVQKSRSGSLVNLEHLAARFGAKAYPMRTVFDAFRLLTGTQPTPRAAVSEAAMALTPSAGTYLAGKAKTWRGIYAKYRNLFDQRKHSNREAMRRLGVAARYLQGSEQHAAGSRFAAAYDFMARAGSFSFTTFQYQDFLVHLKQAIATKQSAGLQAKAATFFKDSVGSKKVFSAIFRLGRPKSVDQAVAVVNAYSLALENMNYLEGAEKLYKLASLIKAQQKGRLSKQKLSYLSRAITYMGVAQSKSLKAGHLVGLASGGGARFNLTAVRLKKIATQFSAMALANLYYADALIVDGLVKRYKKPRWYWKLVLTDYLGAQSNAIRAVRLSQSMSKGSAGRSLAELGAALSSYIRSSMLITKLYSVGAFAQMGKAVKRITNKEALLSMLGHAETNARQAARRAKATTGTIPNMARFYYEIGRVMRQGGASLQVKSLEQFWRSTLLSRLAVMMARAD